MRTRRISAHAIVASSSLMATACGASYQSVYEGDVRFEHCYRLDAEPNVSPQARLACWSDWAASHTAGQTRDRVEYALGRERALRIGDTRPAGPSLVTGVEATRVEAIGNGPSIRTPLPATPFESPPITQAKSKSTPSSSRAALVAPAASEVEGLDKTCVRECGDSFTACATACKQPTCINKCGETAKGCIGQCL